MVNVENLTMHYAGKGGKGVFGVNLNVEKGETLGFLGPNGSGKTTTIRCILGFMKGESGVCTINGIDPFCNAEKIMHNLGFVAGEPVFPPNLSGMDYLKFLEDIQADARPKEEQAVFRNDIIARRDELLTTFELDPRVKIKKMSKGMKQKLGIVSAFMHNPQILILDEPTNGLDPLMQIRFIELIKKQKENGKTILMSSHIFEEVEKTSDKVAIIRDGRIVASDTLKNLREKMNANKVKLFSLSSADAEKIEKNTDKKIKIDRSIKTQTTFEVPTANVQKFMEMLVKSGITVFTTHEPTLENVFIDFYSANGGAK
ncbi:MAG: ABC transporter ATP-binding protein [Christensenellaceae bacterium]|jgi:ABC-2 type transport system ATP-binding protein|nr:ABC transporter ATP-binding protein [Christensenellaceae bacterium]